MGKYGPDNVKSSQIMWMNRQTDKPIEFLYSSLGVWGGGGVGGRKIAWLFSNDNKIIQ